MSFSSIIENIKARGLKDISNPGMWKVYADWAEIEKNGIHLDVEDIIPFAQQIIYRTTQCAPCLAAGKCWHCKCPMPSKMLTPSAWCTTGRWQKVMSNGDWSRYIEVHNLVFSVQHTSPGDIVEDYPEWMNIDDKGVHLKADEIMCFCEQIVVNLGYLYFPDDWEKYKKVRNLKISVISL